MGRDKAGQAFRLLESRRGELLSHPIALMEFRFPIVYLGPVSWGTPVEVREENFVSETKGAVGVALQVAQGNGVPTFYGRNAGCVVLLANQLYRPLKGNLELGEDRNYFTF